MLVLVLITFAISWLPLHIFCLWRDFSDASVHTTKVWFVVHWLAMRLVVANHILVFQLTVFFANFLLIFFSSVVYNPWIYSVSWKCFFCAFILFFIITLSSCSFIHSLFLFAGAEQALSKWNEKLFQVSLEWRKAEHLSQFSLIKHQLCNRQFQ